MERDEFFTTEEKELLFSLYRKLLQLTGETLQKGDCRKLKTHLINSIKDNRVQRDTFGLNPLVKDMQTAVIVAEEIGMKRASILGIMLHESVRTELVPPKKCKPLSVKTWQASSAGSSVSMSFTPKARLSNRKTSATCCFLLRKICV